MKILVIVNESPWGGTLGVTALRLVRALVEEGEQLCAVFFRGDGVYQAQAGREQDAGSPCLSEAWKQISRDSDIPLLICSSDSQRRFGQAPDKSFKEAGLVKMMELMGSSDRVVSL